MNILFISFSEVSLRRGSVRSVAMLCALTDAGHRVDVIAPGAELPSHPHLRVLSVCGPRSFCRRALKISSFLAVRRGVYDAIHAVDDAVFFAAWLGRLKKVPVAYDAVRRFSGEVGEDSSVFKKVSPRRFRLHEIRAIERARIVFSACPALSADLGGLVKGVGLVQLEDIPLQPLCSRGEVDAAPLLAAFEGPPEVVILCSVLSGKTSSLRNLLVAARKVVDAIPGAVFFFRGVDRAQVEQMAGRLDIGGRCGFIASDDLESFLAVLSVSGAVLMVPEAGSRYVNGEVYTLLHSGVPMVAVENAAYDQILTPETCVGVLDSADSIAAGLLRIVQEPLFSLALATAGQQLVADRHAYSSFKHKVRLTYHQMLKKE